MHLQNGYRYKDASQHCYKSKNEHNRRRHPMIQVIIFRLNTTKNTKRLNKNVLHSIVMKAKMNTRGDDIAN